LKENRLRVICEGHLPWMKGWEVPYMSPEEFVASEDYESTIMLMTTNERRIVKDTPFSQRLKRHKGKVGFYIHSTRAQVCGPELFSFVSWTEPELYSHFSYLFTGTPSVAKAIRSKFGREVTAVGLPISLPKPTGVRKKEIIAINQRLQDDNQPYLLLSYMERRKDLNFRVLQNSSWEIAKPIERRFNEMENVEVRYSEGKEEYLKLLEECSVLLSFTFSETFSVSLFEGLALGLCPVFPDVIGVEDIIDNRYEPYSYRDIDEKIRRREIKTLPYYDWISKTSFLDRLRQVNFID
jgi:hypothetical protein